MPDTTRDPLAEALWDYWEDDAAHDDAHAFRAILARHGLVTERAGEIKRVRALNLRLMEEVLACHEALGLNGVGYLLPDTAAQEPPR